MRKLFGGKKKVKEAPKVPVPTLGETSQNLGGRCDVIEAKIKKCNDELAPILQQLKKASKANKKRIQMKACQILKRRKMYEAQQSTMQN
jgi:uncharacterized protein YPO0396